MNFEAPNAVALAECETGAEKEGEEAAEFLTWFS